MSSEPEMNPKKKVKDSFFVSKKENNEISDG